MKYVSILIPDPGPLGETFFDASDRAISAALRVKRPGGGCVESVFTLATHRPVAVARRFTAFELLLPRIAARPYPIPRGAYLVLLTHPDA